MLGTMVRPQCSPPDAVFDSARFDGFVDDAQKENHLKDLILQQI